MTVFAHPIFDLNLTERIASNGSAIARVVRHTGFSLAGLRIDATANPETDATLSVVSGRSLVIASGVADIDLAALPTANGEVVDATGLKLRLAMFANPRGNAAISIEAGPSNGYELFGTDGKVVLGGQSWLPLFDADSRPVVASGARSIRISGTDDESVDVLLALG